LFIIHLVSSIPSCRIYHIFYICFSWKYRLTVNCKQFHWLITIFDAFCDSQCHCKTSFASTMFDAYSANETDDFHLLLNTLMYVQKAYVRLLQKTQQPQSAFTKICLLNPTTLHHYLHNNRPLNDYHILNIFSSFIIPHIHYFFISIY